MVKGLDLKLSKLKLEVPVGSVSSFTISLLYKRLRYEIIRRYGFCSKDPWFSYPVSLSRLLSMFKCNIVDTVYMIGLNNTDISLEYTEDYKKILDVEYCVSGKEMRVLRYVFEKVIPRVREDICQ